MSTTARTRPVRIVTTGGTIASRRDVHGAVQALDPGLLIRSWPNVAAAGESPEVEEFAITGSHELTLDDSWRLARRLRVVAEARMKGIVVTHGTDCLEEAAFLAALIHRARIPIVFTGAQRSADSPHPDGPRNVADAIALASDPHTSQLSVVVAMDGVAFQARDVTKVSTHMLRAFDAPGHRAVARIRGGNVRVLGTAIPQAVLHDAVLPSRLRRVDIVPVYLGADDVLLAAAVAGGGEGIVLEAMGAGNATPTIFEGVLRAISKGIVVAVTTRVATGAVSATYGNGGGHDLAEAGAVMLGDLKAPKARLALSLALAATSGSDHARDLTLHLAGVNGAEEAGCSPTW